MIVIPIYLAIDTYDEDIARSVAEDFDGQPWTTDLPGGSQNDQVSYESRLVEYRGESPVLLKDAPDAGIRTYLPVPGRRIRA
jgi:hypothetical protein